MEYSRLSLADILLMGDDDLVALEHNHKTPIAITPFPESFITVKTETFSPGNGVKLLRRPSNSFINNDGRVIRGKPCNTSGCFNRTQSYGFCKSHGGGTRCNAFGCKKASQGNNRCRLHGGGKRCQINGCEKGSQRKGMCYLHNRNYSHQEVKKEMVYTCRQK